MVELLVVVSIIAMLIMLLLPSMREAMGNAKIVVCATQMRQVGMAGTAYSTDHQLPEVFWRFEDWAGDYPYESAHTKQPGNPARALHMANGHPQHYLPNGKLFFCPTYTLSYEANYTPEPDTSHTQFWGTYTWCFRPLKPSDDPHPNQSASNHIVYDNPSQASNVVMTDTPATAYGTVPSFTWGPQFEHYNALFSDGHVTLISRNVSVMAHFMWGSVGVPYL